MKHSGIFSRLAFLLLLPFFCQSASATLFISEYVEGSSNNKAIEIYNGGLNSIDLLANNYTLQFFFNGSTAAGNTISLTGSVLSNDVYVIADDSYGLPGAGIDQFASGAFFNGDDSVALFMGATLVDFLGRLGEDPGSHWGTGMISTQNHTLRRNGNVLGGDTNPNDIFSPAFEWAGFAQNNVDDLGQYSWNGFGAISIPEPSSLLLFSLGLILFGRYQRRVNLARCPSSIWFP